MATLSENIEFFKLRLQSQPDSLLFARLADYLRQNGEVDDAIEVCESGLKKHPYYVTAHFILGKCYLDKKQFDQALNEFKRVINFDPKFLAAHKYHAEIMEHIGWDNAIENSYRQILEIDPYDQEIKDKLSQLLAQKEAEKGSSEESFPFEPQADIDELSEDLVSSEFDYEDEETVGTEEQPPDLPEEMLTDEFEEEREPEDAFDELKQALEEEAISNEIAAVDEDEFDVQGTEEETEFEEEAELDLQAEAPMEADSETEETPKAGIDSDQIFEAVIEEEPPSAEDEEKFSYILDDIFRDEETSDETGAASDTDTGDEFDFLGKIESEEQAQSTPEQQEKPTNKSAEPEESSKPEQVPDLDLGDETDPDAEEAAAKSLNNIFPPEENEDDFPDMSATEPPESETEKSRKPGDESQLFERIRDFSDEQVPTGKTDSGETTGNNEITEQPAMTQKAPEESVESENGKRKKEKIVTPTLGEIYAAQAQYAKAIGVFEILRKKEPDNPAYVEKINFLKKKLAESSEN